MRARPFASLTTLVATSLVVGSACGARSDMPGGFAVASDGGRSDGRVVPIGDAGADVVTHDGSIDGAPSKPDVGVELPLCREAFEAGVGEYCTRSLRVVSVKLSESGCFVDLPFVAGSEGILVYFCTGEGAAYVSFGDLELRGASRNASVDVCYSTTYDWTDGCTWTSVQRITGSVVAGRLAFTYAESPSGTGCARACTATGEIEVL